MKKTSLIIVGLLFLFVSLVGVSYAAFVDTSKVLGSKFSVGSADIKLLLDLSGDLSEQNLVEDIEGPSFSNIGSNWQDDYLVKIYNNSEAEVLLQSTANYETANDPNEIRQVIFVEPFEWDDVNNDGLLQEGELGQSFGQKTIVKWKTEGFVFNSLASGNVYGLVLRFSTDTVSATKQGASAIFDFEFDSLSE